MKNKIKQTVLSITLCATIMSANAQNQSKPVAAVLGIDSKGVIQNSESVGYIVRLELEKANVYNLMDKYDVAEAVKKNNIDVTTCFGKSCVVGAGKSLGVDKMITGSVERFGEKIVISLKVIDVKSELVEKQDATEYLNLQPELQKMIGISVKKLMGITLDQELVNVLINYDQPVQSPKTQLRLNGPRMGAAMILGEEGKILQESAENGGFDMYPAMFQFGWQKEWQYLSAGNFQALVEFVPMVSGLESGKFIPSATFMNGFRFGKGGWEFAFGPSFRVVTKSNMYKDAEGVWQTTSGWKGEASNNFSEVPGFIDGQGEFQKFSTASRLDSRGDAELSTSLILGIGRTFKSGYLNIPVNLYISPRKSGTMLGFSFGFNIYKKPRVQ